jgi:glycine cleavage system H protein
MSSLESGKWVGKIFAPVSGEITQANSELDDSPELLNQSPYGDGWIGKIKPSNLDAELANLMKVGPDFEKFMREEMDKHKK